MALVQKIGHVNYNPVILNYYRLQNNLQSFTPLRKDWADQMWSATDKTEEGRVNTRNEVYAYFRESSYLVIPEYSSQYQWGPYAFYRYHEDIVNFLNSSEAPRFVVRRVLHDVHGSRVLLIQREAEEGGEGIPLKLPFGPKPDPVGKDPYVGLPTDKGLTPDPSVKIR